MLIRSYLRLVKRLLLRSLCPILMILALNFSIIYYRIYSNRPTPTNDYPVEIHCNATPSVDKFLRGYKPYAFLGSQHDSARAEPTSERIRLLLDIVRSKEHQYQSLLHNFDVFDMSNPLASLKAYGSDASNIEEIRMLYNRYIKLAADGKTLQVTSDLIDYLRQISSYLSDGLRDRRIDKVIATPYSLCFAHRSVACSSLLCPVTRNRCSFWLAIRDSSTDYKAPFARWTRTGLTIE